MSIHSVSLKGRDSNRTRGVGWVADLPTFDERPDVALEMPSQLAAMAQRCGPIFKRELPDALASGAKRLVYLVGPEANRFVLQTHRDRFSHEHGMVSLLGPLFGKSLLGMDGELWAMHRRFLAPAFTTDAVALQGRMIYDIIASRVRKWPDSGVIDLVAEARETAFDVSASTLLGNDVLPELNSLRGCFSSMLDVLRRPPAETPESLVHNTQHDHDTLRSVLLPIISTAVAARQGTVAADVLGLLFQAHDQAGAPLAAEQLVAHLSLLLAAGYENTATLAAWTLALVATHRSVLLRVLQELETVLGSRAEARISPEQVRELRFLGLAINEAGRLHSPVRNVARGVVQSFEFGGYAIPAGEQIRLALAAGHRLPNVFADPAIFDPDRFAPPRQEGRGYELLIFGGGPRVCLGASLAHLEVRILVAHILRTFHLELINDQQLKNEGVLLASPPDGIRVRVVRKTG